MIETVLGRFVFDVVLIDVLAEDEPPPGGNENELALLVVALLSAEAKEGLLELDDVVAIIAV